MSIQSDSTYTSIYTLISLLCNNLEFTTSQESLLDFWLPVFSKQHILKLTQNLPFYNFIPCFYFCCSLVQSRINVPAFLSVFIQVIECLLYNTAYQVLEVGKRLTVFFFLVLLVQMLLPQKVIVLIFKIKASQIGYICVALKHIRKK